MSGCSDMTDCPRCLGKDTLDIYSDWKPFEQTTGECLRCGFHYYYKFGITPKKEIKERHEDYDDKKLLKEFSREYSKEEKKRIKEFDEMYGVEK